MIFYIEDISRGSITKSQTDHFFSMRVKSGDEIWVTDLNGSRALISIKNADKRDRVVVYSVVKREKKATLEEKILFQAIPDKQYLEKLCEVAPLAGITKIVLFESDNTQIGTFSLDRLEKILIRSCEQCELTTKPKLELVEKDAVIKQITMYNPIVLDCVVENSDGKTATITHYNSVLVGPEGGWSKAEQKTFREMGLRVQYLGSIILPAWIAGYSWFCKFGS